MTTIEAPILGFAAFELDFSSGGGGGWGWGCSFFGGVFLAFRITLVYYVFGLFRVLGLKVGDLVVPGASSVSTQRP